MSTAACSSSLRASRSRRGGPSSSLWASASSAAYGMSVTRPRHRSYQVLASGIARLLHIKLARALGADQSMATDVSEYRLDAAKRFGADHVFKATDDVPHAREGGQRRGGRRPRDCLHRCVAGVRSGVQITRQGQHAPDVRAPGPWCRSGGPIRRPLEGRSHHLTTYAGSPKDIEQAIELIRSRRLTVTDIITHRFGLADTQKGFEAVAKAQDSIKVVIEPQR